MLLKLERKIVLLASLLLGIVHEIKSLTSYSRSDPFPVYTSLDPQYFLYNRKKLQLKGWETIPRKPESVGFYISPFGVNANQANNMQEVLTAIGDLEFGRWDMIALLYGAVPQGQALAPILVSAQQNLFPPNGPILNDPNLIDPNQQFGFFSFPAVFRKRGIRFEFDANIIEDFGITLQTGLADICQTSTQAINFIDTVPIPSFPNNPELNTGCQASLSGCSVDKFLMDQLKIIAQQICLDLTSFHEFSVEEIRFYLWWRHAFPINQGEDEYAEFLFIPFFDIGGSISPGKVKNPNKAFGVGFGNNGHGSVGFDAGFDMDFYDTIDIGGEAGYTHFFKKDCAQLRVPNSLCQSGIFPFSTNVSIQPGDNWYLAAKMNAYHYLDNLSMYFQYVFLEHKKDQICVLNQDPAFFPIVIERISDWKVHLANVGFTYDCSPNISLGFLWQAPLAQMNVYRSTTVMFSLNIVY